MNQTSKSIIQLLTTKEMTVSVAESCTGGSIARLLTKVPGASHVFKAGLVAYDPIIKQQILGVPITTMQNFGIVSRETAISMAMGCARQFKTDWSLATTGYAGPGGGDDNNPVGTVYISIYSPRLLRSGIWLHKFEGTRDEIMSKAAKTALKHLESMLH